MAPDLDDDALEEIISRARVHRLCSLEELESILARSSCRGTPRLRRLLNGADARKLKRSKAERRLLALVRQAELPTPEVNVTIEGHEVDVCWRAHRLVVEFDGFAVHGDREAFETDRRRDARLVAAGYRVMRVTWRQITHRPMLVVARIAQALAAAHV